LQTGRLQYLMRQHRFLKSESSAIRSLSIVTITIFLLFALPGLGECVHASQETIPTTAQLRQVIVAHYRAIEENQLNQAMRQYHSQSPDKAQARENIEDGLSQFLQKTKTINFCYDGLKEGLVFATAQHKFLRISGIKFTVEFIDMVYQLREEQGNWKIWSQQITRRGFSDCQTAILLETR